MQTYAIRSDDPLLTEALVHKLVAGSVQNSRTLRSRGVFNSVKTG